MLVDDFEPLKGQMFQVLDHEGNVRKDLEPKIDNETLVRAYKAMVLTRLGDDKAVKLQRQGRMGAYPPSKGQEASQVGPALVLEDGDWTVWAFREMGALLVRGVPLWQQYLYWMGNEEGSNYPEGVRVTPSVVPVGSQLPHAVGIGYAMKHRQQRSVVLCYFGDGATSEGDFHESLNFSGVFKTPNVFVCQNNQYAISLPRERQTAAKSLAQKAIAYGIPGIQVDGNDVLALYAATKEAVERARNGDGPTLIESYTYRLGDHTTSDDATRYRKEKELEYWEARDPLSRFRVYLESKKAWDEEKEKSYRAEAEALVEEAAKKAETFPIPSLDDAFRFTYSTMSANLAEQLEFMRKDLGGQGGG